MKKMMKLVLCLLAVFLMVSCAPAKKADDNQPKEAQKKFKAGTYTGKGQGHNGEIQVEVTFSDDKITEVKVGKHAETPNISEKAIADLPKAIVEKQSLSIDAISGATYTSEGIMNAIKDAITQAGGKPEEFMSKTQEVTKAQEETLDADVVIVGAGGSGMVAAVRAAENGLKVILVEKMSYMGGAFSVSGGNQVVSGSKLQKDQGVSNDSVDTMVADFMKNGNNLNNKELLTLYAQNVGETTDWLSSKVGVGYVDGLHKLAEYSVDRELAYKDGGKGATAALKAAIEKAGVKVLLNTRAEELLVKDGQVVGVKASEKNKVNYTLNAKAVILATGGYGNSKELLSKELQSRLYYGPESSTGDGVIMATKDNVNANTIYMEYGKTYPNGIEVSEGRAKSTIAGNIPAFKKASILVNKNGERVVNEKGSNRTILEALVKQEGKQLYFVIDQATFDVWQEKLGPAGISKDDIKKYLENNGKSAPVFAHGETLEEAAKNAGVNAENLKKTVEKYNGFVDKKKDDDFNRPADFLNEKLEKGPFYIIEQKPRFATTMGGLVIDKELHVLSKDNKVIKGLYAAGEVVGSVMGDDSPSGANNGWAVTSGRLVADSVKNDLSKEAK